MGIPQDISDPPPPPRGGRGLGSRTTPLPPPKKRPFPRSPQKCPPKSDFFLLRRLWRQKKFGPFRRWGGGPDLPPPHRPLPPPPPQNSPGIPPPPPAPHFQCSHHVPTATSPENNKRGGEGGRGQRWRLPPPPLPYSLFRNCVNNTPKASNYPERSNIQLPSAHPCHYGQFG